MEINGIHPDYEFSRLGTPVVGEYFVSALGAVEQAKAEDVTFIADSYPVIVVVRKMKWIRVRRDRIVPPTGARFRDYRGHAWNHGTLVAYAYGTHRYKDQDGRFWRMCEVLSEYQDD